MTPRRGFTRLTRREFLAAAGVAAIGAVAAACDDDGDTPEPAAGSPTSALEPTSAPTRQVLAPTPACGDDDDDVTVAQTEGPYFTPDSPERVSLREPGITGDPMTVSGLVLSTACAPVARALVDFWQCDDAGVYDNEGYRLRGHQFTDDAGRYRLETIVPGLYPGRTRHIHVKVQAPGRDVLTTQLYFPDDTAQNAADGIFDAALVMTTQQSAGEMTGAFDFVLDV